MDDSKLQRKDNGCCRGGLGGCIGLSLSTGCCVLGKRLVETRCVEMDDKRQATLDGLFVCLYEYAKYADEDWLWPSRGLQSGKKIYRGFGRRGKSKAAAAGLLGAGKGG